MSKQALRASSALNHAAVAQHFRDNVSRVPAGNSDYWTFRHNAVRRHAHALLQYPAMMVPQMQGELIAAACKADPGISRVYDPFVGSGTVLVESMLQGLDFAGFDINPLAVLICRAKAGPFYAEAMRRRSLAALARVEADTRSDPGVDFPNLDKWFTEEAAAHLGRIRRAILAESQRWARRFLWIALAETVRLTSNSRTSTFKLHIRPKDELLGPRESPVAVFDRITRQNIERYKEIADMLKARGKITSGAYYGRVEADFMDARIPVQQRDGRPAYDLLVTSPPYGDNVSTVPYGQYSYLPLQWIDFADISPAVDNRWLRTTHEIDFHSLGGSRVLDAQIADESEKSPTLRRTLSSLKDLPRDRAQRVTAFCRDLDGCVDGILNALRPGALMILTLGNRKVGGKPVPMDAITEELFAFRGARQVIRLQRQIPNKRMAVKNNISRTMRTESILVMQKGDT